MASENGRSNTRRLRSRDWFDDPERLDQTALYLERFMNYGNTPDELRSGRPVVGIAQSGSDLSPCNRHHLQLASRVRDGIRDAGGIPMEFPVHPINENCRRPTAALDRNLFYLGLVEILYGYFLDAVVLTTGCDKTTPAAIMAASTVDIPAIVLSGGPMLDGYFEGELVGSGMAIWKSRRRLAMGQIDEETFYETALASAPSAGHCNTMGTASTMNSLAEVLGLSLPGCADDPGALPRARPDGLPDGEAHRRDGQRGPAPIEDSDPPVLPERHRRNHGHRRLDQRPAAHHGHGAPRRRRTRALRLGARIRRAAARQHAASRRVPGRAVPPSGRSTRGGQRAPAGGQDRRRGPDRHRPDAGGERRGKGEQRPRDDQRPTTSRCRSTPVSGYSRATSSTSRSSRRA